MNTNQETETAHSRAVVPGVHFTEAAQQHALDINAAVWAYGAHIERNKPAEVASAAVSGKERRWFGRF